jgi:hypothetical protein
VHARLFCRTKRTPERYALIALSAASLDRNCPNDGYVEVDLVAGHPSEPGGLRAFSIKFFGETYDSFFFNENGVLSFGAPLTAPPRDIADVFNAGVPVIAPFLPTSI